MTIKCNRFALLSLRLFMYMLTLHLILVQARWRSVPSALCRVLAKEIKIEWLQCWVFVPLVLHAFKKPCFYCQAFLFGVNSVRNEVDSGTRARLSTEENGGEGISRLYTCCSLTQQVRWLSITQFFVHSLPSQWGWGENWKKTTK